MISRSLVQPIGQKRLTNVAVVRLKKCGMRFEIACYKNKVLSWRSGVEKDLDEVLQSQIVYSNVSKGILAKSKDLKMAFGTDDQSKICLEILDKGELQVAGKERESQFTSQFRDIATIVMQKTINPETQRHYTISMIERLMHDIHFAVDPHSSSKKQALEVIRELQKHFPIKRAPMRVKITIPEGYDASFSGKLDGWGANIISKSESGGLLSMTCEIDPSFFRDCNSAVRNMQGRLDLLAVSVDIDGEACADHGSSYEIADMLPTSELSEPIDKLGKEFQKQVVVEATKLNDQQSMKLNKCSTCDVVLKELREYREHFKTEWHRHNLRRKAKQLPPLPFQDYLGDAETRSSLEDLKDYSF